MDDSLRGWEVSVDTRHGFEIIKTSKTIMADVIEHSYDFISNKNAQYDPKEAGCIRLTNSFPYVDTSFIWHPTCDTNRKIMADWAEPIETMTAISAPVACLFSEDSGNRYTVALSEIKERVKFQFGIREEDGTMACKIEIPITDVICREGYKLKLIEDSRAIPYYQAIGHVAKWWENTLELDIMDVPEDARMPVYSTWYSYHQNLFEDQIEAECKAAAELGLKSIIVDDGWQTMDNNRGYAFCGEWEAAQGRFKDFTQHIRKVHELGMKYLIWYSVPFAGKKSKVWDQFKDKLLRKNDALETGILDPRYPEIRAYLAGIYETAVRDWNLDGLKLDFIDQFYEDAATPAYQDQMDFVSVQDALDFMMMDIKKRLQAIKPDIMIEFRQRYIGPNMRKYGNMFRVNDCPTSGITNRVGIADLRLLSGNTAVHSDMLMWHKDEKAEIAALQIINSIFGTVQISIKLTELPPEHKKMLGFWLEFMKRNRKLLQESMFIPYEPQLLYPLIQVRDGSRSLFAVYSQNRIIEFGSDLEELTVINGTKQQKLALSFDKEQLWEIVEKDCFGAVVSEQKIKIGSGCRQFNITTAGLLEFKRAY